MTDGFDLRELLAAACVDQTVRGVQRALHVNGVMARQLLERDLTVAEADRYAMRLGHHPAEVWDTWQEISDESTGVNWGQQASTRVDAVTVLPDPDIQPLMEVEELVEAGVFAIGLNATYKAIRQGHIPAVWRGRRVYIPTREIRRMVGLS